MKLMLEIPVAALACAEFLSSPVSPQPAMAMVGAMGAPSPTVSRQSRIDESRRLASLAEKVGASAPKLRLLLAVESALATDHPVDGWPPESQQALVDALAWVHGTNLVKVPDKNEVAIGVSVSPDARWALLGGGDNPTRVIDLTSDTPNMAASQIPVRIGVDTCIAWTPDGRRAAIAESDHAIGVWDVAQGGERIAQLIGHTRPIDQIVWSADGRRLVSVSSDGAAMMWAVPAEGDAAVGRSLGRLQGRITPPTWSPDGRRMAICDSVAGRIWDNANPDVRPIALPDPGVALEWRSDRIVTTSPAPGRWNLWDLGHDDPAAQPLSLETAIGPGAHPLGFDPNTRWMIVSRRAPSNQWLTDVWDLSEGLGAIRRLDLPEGVPIRRFRLSPDRRRAAVTRAEGLDRYQPPATVEVWDLSSATPWSSPMTLRVVEWFSPQGSVDWSPDGRFVITGAMEGFAQVFEPSGTDPGEPLMTFRAPEMRYTLGGEWVWTVKGDQMANMTYTGALVCRLDPHTPATHVIETHPNPSREFDWWRLTPDGKRLVVPRSDRFGTRFGAPLWIWDFTVHSAWDDVIKLRGQLAKTQLCWSPDGRAVAGVHSLGGESSALCIWKDDPAAQWSAPLVLRTHNDANHAISSFAWSPDSQSIAAGCCSGTIHIWTADVPDHFISKAKLSGHDGPVPSVAWSPDGLRLATGSSDRTARVWDLQAQDPSTSPLVLRGHPGGLVSVAWSGDGRRILTVCDHRSARVWDTSAKDPEKSSIVVPSRPFHGCESPCWSPSASRLATASNDPLNDLTIQILDFDGADPLAPSIVLHGSKTQVTAIAWSPDGQRVAAGSWDSMLRVWDLNAADPAPPVLELPTHTSNVTAVRWSPHCDQLVTFEVDGSVADLWDLQNSALPPVPILLPVAPRRQIEDVSWRPDGRRIAMNLQPIGGSGEGSLLCVWDLSPEALSRLAWQALGRNLSREEWSSSFPTQPYRSTFPNRFAPDAQPVVNDRSR